MIPTEYAVRVWNNLPYDHATCQPFCPTAEDMQRALTRASGDVAETKSLFQIRALFHTVDNKLVKDEVWNVTFYCPEGPNAAIYEGCMAVLARSMILSGDKEWQKSLTPTAVEIYTFISQEVASNGYLAGNTGTEPIGSWKVKDAMSRAAAMDELQGYAYSFKSSSSKKIQFPHW